MGHDDKKYDIKEGELLPKYDENGFALQPDYTCDFCGYPNDETEYKQTEYGEYCCKSCYEEQKE
ncbi:hypothetical protein IHV09_21970 [Fictibacillus sp. 23RED33]|uniref:hypothetical protein n=1 Tax=Fictibacillus sp. 23RED33 TaxID=2745879 RepID=UPI0018CFAFD6|nr:hypothetical protein [Fictibacillus sp. 23RED33]MBH0176227.1 hypothetical protein [Fictibacillus sp. 23RED33]